MEARWYTLDAAALPSGIALIDATPAAAPFWDRDGPILSLLEELCDRLPVAARPTVVPLGGRRAAPLDSVLNTIRSGALGAIGLGRFPVAGPLLREWARTPPRPMLLVTNGPVHDLEDWAVPEVTASLLVYRMTGTGRVTPEPLREVGPESDLAALAEHLHDPLAGVRVGTPAFVVDWGPVDLVWADGEIDATAELPAVLLAHPDGFNPRAELRRASGGVLRAALTPIAPPPARPAVPVPQEGVSVLRLWQAGKAFFCPTCRAAHPPGRLTCADGSGRLLIPPLTGTGTAWLLRRRDGWAATPHPHGLYCLSDGRIAACRSGRWAVYEFEAGQWSRSDLVEDLIAIDDDTLLLMS